MRKIIKGQKLKFTSKKATTFYLKILKKWRSLIQNKDYLIFLPCASTKPIQNSRTHCFLSPITRTYNKNVMLAIISEPLTIIPYYEKFYPNYDYLPEDLWKDDSEVQLFVDRLNEFHKITPSTIKVYYIGGSHHYKVLKKTKWKFKYIEPKRGLIGYKDAATNLKEKIFQEKKQKRIKFKTNQINISRVEIAHTFA
ncbi:MAG: hypothetical protein GF364_16015 [Candidatus Lokiarchaeota archaeon]|nr:hypothetical protein [Candidatus Lokiarchaeota archaeon]